MLIECFAPTIGSALIPCEAFSPIPIDLSGVVDSVAIRAAAVSVGVFLLGSDWPPKTPQRIYAAEFFDLVIRWEPAVGKWLIRGAVIRG